MYRDDNCSRHHDDPYMDGFLFSRQRRRPSNALLLKWYILMPAQQQHLYATILLLLSSWLFFVVPYCTAFVSLHQPISHSMTRNAVRNTRANYDDTFFEYESVDDSAKYYSDAATQRRDGEEKLYGKDLESIILPVAASETNAMADSQPIMMFPSERTCLKFLHACVTTKNVTNAILFLDRLLFLQISLSTPITAKSTYPDESQTDGAITKVTPRIWAVILKVCAVAGDHKMAYELLCRMGQYNQSPNVRHCTAYIKALIVANKLNMAARFLSVMAQTSDYPETCTMTPDMDDSNIFENLHILESPDMIAIKTVLHGCVEANNYLLARDVCDHIKNGTYGDMVQIDEKCYNMLLATCPDAITANEILREIRLTRRHRFGVVRPSAITYTKAIAACRKSRNVEHAKAFLTMARNDGIPPDSFMYSSGMFNYFDSVR
jgi:pentatricopeptide repeat protein